MFIMFSGRKGRNGIISPIWAFGEIPQIFGENPQFHSRHVVFGPVVL